MSYDLRGVKLFVKINSIKYFSFGLVFVQHFLKVWWNEIYLVFISSRRLVPGMYIRGRE